MISTSKLFALIVIVVAAGPYAANDKTNDLGWLPLELVGFLMLMDVFLSAEKVSAREAKQDKPALPLGEDSGLAGRWCRALVWPPVPSMPVLVVTLAAFALLGGESCYAQAGMCATELAQAPSAKTDTRNFDELKAPKSTQVAKSPNQPGTGGLTSRFKLSTRLVWGEDMSRTLQGAGGIAGLLRAETVPEHQPSTPPPSTTSYFSYDSNGNVILLTNAEATTTARYAYDAFGKTTKATGPAAQSNRYRFSTKPIEDQGGLAFYGFRYYSPELGRWVSRDPSGERSGVNLFKFTSNDLISSTDTLGLVGCNATELENCKAECARRNENFIDCTRIASCELYHILTLGLFGSITSCECNAKQSCQLHAENRSIIDPLVWWDCYYTCPAGTDGMTALKWMLHMGECPERAFF